MLFSLMGCQSDYDVVSEPVNIDPGEVTECGFTPISGTKFSRYDCNPVFSGTDAQWGAGGVGAVGFKAEVVLGHPFYQMWYVSYPDANDTSGASYGLGYAISGDGTNWEDHPGNPVLTQTLDGRWDQDGMSGVQVLWNDQTESYLLAYQGLNYGANQTGLGFYESEDGVNWKYFDDAHSMALQLSGEQPDGNTMCWPLAFTRYQGRYRGYMAGGVYGVEWQKSLCEVYTYEGADLANLSFSSQPYVQAGPALYDAHGMTSASVVEYEGTLYMFYAGFERWTNSNDGWISATNSNLSLATSTDGTTFTKDAGNPFRVFADQPGQIRDVAAQVVGSRIHLWITDNYAVGYKPDGSTYPIDSSAVGYFIYEPKLESPHP